MAYLLANSRTFSQRYHESSAFLQSMSHDDEVINFVTLSDLWGYNVKSWAKELKKLQKNQLLVEQNASREIVSLQEGN